MMGDILTPLYDAAMDQLEDLKEKSGEQSGCEMCLKNSEKIIPPVLTERSQWDPEGARRPEPNLKTICRAVNLRDPKRPLLPPPHRLAGVDGWYRRRRADDG